MMQDETRHCEMMQDGVAELLSFLLPRSRPSYPPRGVKNVTYIFGVPLCRVSGPWLYTTYIHIYVGCFTQIHKVNVKMLHYIFRLGKQIYKSNV